VLVALATLIAFLLVVVAPSPSSAAPDDGLLYQFEGRIHRTTEAGAGDVTLTPGRAHLGLAEPSPDGSRIAYQVGPGGPYRIEVMDADGSDVRSVTTGNAPSWSPDGSLLYFREFNSGWKNYQIDLTTGARTQIARQVVRWNHAGTAYLYTYAGNLYASTAPVATDPTLSRSLVASGSDNGWWHPNDDLILYRTSTSLRTVGPDGSGDRLLVDVSGGPHTPFGDWSPDGTRIAYVTSSLDGIYTARADGTDSRQIRTEFGYNVPRFIGPARPDPCANQDPPPECVEPLHLLIVGDSVAWGQGLEEPSKYSTIVGQGLEAMTGRPVEIDRGAHSGASLTGGCGPSAPGEVPFGTPSTECQIQTAADEGTHYDLVLLSGCINDVSVEYLFVTGLVFDPPGRTADRVRGRVEQECAGPLADVVAQARELPGSPRVILTGYYPIVSDETDQALLLDRLGLGLAPRGLRNGFYDRAIARSAAFDEGVDALGAQVAADAGDGVAFVSPAFGPERALFTPGGASYLWNGTDDPLLVERTLACAATHGTDTVAVALCAGASLGHPNEAGASRYAERILDAIQLNGWSFET
jgi:lysophospholipase L1-like esterase